MEKVLRHGLMAQVMKEIIQKGKKMDMEFLNGMMAQYMKGNFQIITLMEKVHINGQIKDNLLECGKIIK